MLSDSCGNCKASVKEPSCSCLHFLSVLALKGPPTCLFSVCLVACRQGFLYRQNRSSCSTLVSRGSAASAPDLLVFSHLQLPVGQAFIFGSCFVCMSSRVQNVLWFFFFFFFLATACSMQNPSSQFPDQTLNLCPLHWDCGSLHHWTTREIPRLCFKSALFLLSNCEKVKMLVALSCPTLCDARAYSPPGSSVHGILQVRILERVAIPFSR